MKLKVRKGDTVMVISGKSKGQKGKILEVDRAKNRVFVEGVNIVKRHTKPNPQLQQGGIIPKEAPVHVSNVLLVCPECGRPTRVGKKVLETGKRVRICKKCGEACDS